MKKLAKWGIVILVLSGWLAFGILYAVSARDKAQADVKITELESELDSYQFLVRDVASSQEKIDSMISALEALKRNLERLKNKIDKQEEKQN